MVKHINFNQEESLCRYLLNKGATRFLRATKTCCSPLHQCLRRNISLQNNKINIIMMLNMNRMLCKDVMKFFQTL